MKRQIIAIILATAIAGTFAFAACGEHKHSWNEGVVKKAPTCISRGIMLYTCECGEAKTEPIPTIPHPFSTEWSYDENGHYHACTTTGCTAKDEVIPHSWNEGEIITPATCITDGEQKLTCKVCTYSENKTIEKTGVHNFDTKWSYDDNEHFHVCTAKGCTERKDAAGHTYDLGKITTEPLCYKDGVKTYTCTECGHKKTESVPKTNAHSFDTKWSSDENGHYYACTTKGCTERQGFVEHSWNEGKITKPSTCAENGVKTYDCTVCGHTKNESLEKTTDHIKGDWVVDSTSGAFVRKCTVCHKNLETAPDLQNSSKDAEVCAGEPVGFKLFTKNSGPYKITVESSVDNVDIGNITATISYSSRSGSHTESHNLKQSDNSFTVQLDDKSIAYLTISTESAEKKQIKVTFMFTRNG